MRVPWEPCEHGNYGECPRVIWSECDHATGIQSYVFCPGGREPTRQELWAYAKSKGWIDYEAAWGYARYESMRLALNGRGDDLVALDKVDLFAAVDAALRTEDK